MLMDLFKQLKATYNNGLKYQELLSNYEMLKKSFDTEKRVWTDAIDELHSENLLLYSEIDDLQYSIDNPVVVDPLKAVKQLKSSLPNKQFKHFINGMDKASVPIQAALNYDPNGIVKDYRDKINSKYSPKSALDCVEAVIKYFLTEKRPVYVRDKGEYWKPADEYLNDFKGDCEDASIAMHVLIREVLILNGFEKDYDRLLLHFNDNLIEYHINNLWMHTDGYLYTIESTIDAKGTFRLKWLRVPFAFDSFYTKSLGVGNVTRSWLGSNALRKQYK